MASPATGAILQLSDHGELRTFESAENGAILYEAGKPRSSFTQRTLTRGVDVQLAPGQNAATLAASVGAKSQSAVPFAPGRFLFEAETTADAVTLAQRLTAQPGVIAVEPLLGRQQQRRFVPADTYFTNQWHLRNTGQKGGTPGIDINVTNAWENYKGDGITIGIVDDGLQYTHPDLEANYNAAGSTNINNGSADPTPDVTVDYHGTACAGIAAAVGNNSLGVCGVAFHASVAGIRLLGSGAITTDADEANAMSYRNDIVHIKSNSWGPPDDGQTLAAPGPLTQAALADGVQNGRGGNGTIFVWAAGNGLQAQDDANYDGYANSVDAISVSAITDQGVQTDNSEPGACIAVCAPSASDDRQDVTTVDLVGNVGYNTSSTGTNDLSDRNYTEHFGNNAVDGADSTSAAAPMVAGVAALVLQANPNLGWRDVQEILMRSATKNDPTDADWTTNPAGFHFNHKYGAGLVNAGAAVNLAVGWTNLPAQTNLVFAQTNLSEPVPDGDPGGVTNSFVVSSDIRVERVALTANIPHEYRGDLAITLISPSGVQSRLAELHNDGNPDYVNWVFTTVHDWGESSQGTWKVKVADLSSGDTGTVMGLTLTVYGSSQTATTNATFRILSLQPNKTNALVTFSSASGKTYNLERSTNLTTSNWITVASNIAAGGTSTSATDPNPVQSASFYRVRLLP